MQDVSDHKNSFYYIPYIGSIEKQYHQCDTNSYYVAANLDV